MGRHPPKSCGHERRNRDRKAGPPFPWRWPHQRRERRQGWVALVSELREPDFDALRGREDFQGLFAEVEARAKKPPETALP